MKLHFAMFVYSSIISVSGQTRSLTQICDIKQEINILINHWPVYVTYSNIINNPS